MKAVLATVLAVIVLAVGTRAHETKAPNDAPALVRSCGATQLGQGKRPVIPPGKEVRVLVGAEARGRFLSKISAQTMMTAAELAHARGWRRTENFTVIEVVPTAGIVPTAAGQTLADWSGELDIWEWDTGNPNTWGATLTLINGATGTGFTFDEEYDVYTGDIGVHVYTDVISYRDADGRERPTRASFDVVPARPPFKLALASLGLPQGTCADQRRAYRQCVNSCLRGKLSNAFGAFIGGVTGGLLPCAKLASKAGWWGPYVAAGAFLACDLGTGGIAAGVMVIRDHFNGPCDGPGACGAAPACR